MKIEKLKELDKGRKDGSGTWNPLEKARYFLLLLRRLQGNPGTLARGVALGVFVGITPTIPFHTVQIIALSPLLRANPVAAVVASLVISNPITIPLEYYGAWKVGTMLTGFSIPWSEVKALLANVEHAGLFDACAILMHKSVKLVEAMLAGGFVIALPAALISYFAALRFYSLMAARRGGPPAGEPGG